MLSLETKRNEIDRSYNTLLSSRTTWRPIPLELVAEIFELVHEQDDTRSLPTTISLVSSEWRAFALCVPRIWTRIHISDDADIRTATTWLERSGNVPVSATFSFLDEAYNHTLSKSIYFLRSHLPRIGELTVTVRTEVWANQVIRALWKRAPNLRRFHIISTHLAGTSHFNEWSVDDLHTGSFLGDKEHPKLRSLSILSPHSSWSSQAVKHITELELTTFGKITISSLQALFEDMPCISTLKVCEDDWTPEFFDSWPDTQITVASITQAHVRCSHLHTSIHFLQLLDLPHLHSLHLDLTHAYHEHHFPNHHTPFPILDTLILSMNTVVPSYTDEPALPLLLKRCDSVTRLCLHASGDLTPLNAFGEGRCPRVVHLDICEQSAYNLNYDNLDEFLDTRASDKHGEMAAIETLSFGASVTLSEEKASKYGGSVEVTYLGKKLQ